MFMFILFDWSDVILVCAVFFVAELQNKLQELGRQLDELNERRMMLEVELSIIDTSDRKVVLAFDYVWWCFYRTLLLWLASSNSSLP